ncbi:Rhomboid family intramembrane serine protease [Desulfonema limicola]|uniref:Rhomboid family intramembrane serine protease n=1 Tax=Desulfonema limicola TaxID=45656 RepID=A0A975GFL5_9BACT|nr:rhomboid family intramembrane serine protease [Desulfonema limicola]QTA79304.1 Rhomboid family intramembrane serine protease [Desulfonema limicola]
MTSAQKGSILCPNCRKLINKDESICPFCGIGNPNSGLKNNILIQGFSSGEYLINTIIYISAGLYILSLMFYPPHIGLSNPFNAFSPDNYSLLLLGATGTIPIGELSYWWTLVSASYLHGSLLHIIFNMLAFRQIGNLVINLYGINRMIIIWFFAGITGFMVSYLAGVRFTIGASAAICGMIGAALYYGKSRGGVFGQAVYKQVSAWVMGIFLIGLMPGINNWGHGGGIAAGILLGFVFKYQEQRRDHFFDKALAGICIFITAVILIWCVGLGLVSRISG